MKEIDDYIDSLYKNTNNKYLDTTDMKNDMKLHLVESVENLKKQGKTEDESIKIAISMFGESQDIQQELQELLGMSQKNIRFTLYISIISLLILLTLTTLLIISPNKLDQLNSPITILIIPIYIIIRCIKLESKRKLGIKLNPVSEIYKLLLISYIIYIVSKTLFPITFIPSFQSLLQFSIEIIPLQTVIKLLNSLSYSGLSENFILIGFLKRFISYVPLGFLIPIALNKFKSLKHCIFIGLSIYIISLLIQILFIFIGISINKFVIISFDYLITNILGLLLGYFLYYLFKNISQNY